MSILWGAAQVALLGAASVGYGGVALRRLFEGRSAFERLYIRFALGLGAVVMAVMAGGWLRLWGPWFHHALLACGILLLIADLPRAAGPTGHLFWKRDLLWAAPLLALLLFYAAFPPTFYDSLLYHLGVPGYYLQAGKFVPWSENLFSALPQNAEMLNLLLLSGGSTHGPKLLSLATALAVFLFLADWAAGEAGLRHAWLPGLIFFSIPEAAFLAVTEKNDLLLMLFLLPGVRLLAPAGRAIGWKECAAGGVFLGLAAGVKWQGLIYGAAFAAAHLFFGVAPLGKRVRQAFLIGLIVVLLIAPWLIKNTATFGNPFHPYLAGVFSSTDGSAAQARQIGEGVRRGQGFSFGAILAFGQQMFLSPYSLGLTHITGVLLLLLVPLLLFGGRLRGRGFLLSGCALGFVLLLAVSRVPRYFLPIFLVLALPLAAAWERMEEKLPRYRRGALALLLVLVLIQAVQAVSLMERMTLAARYSWGKLQGKLPAAARYLDIVPYYPAIAFINSILPIRARIAFIGEERTFYIQRPFLASSSFDRNPALDDLLSAPYAAGWAQRLRDRGITHVLFSSQGLLRLGRNSPASRIPSQLQRRLGEILASWPKLFDDGRYALYQVGS